MKKKILPFSITALLTVCLFTACAGGTADPGSAATESSFTSADMTTVSAENNGGETVASADNAGELSVYQGKWFDVNGDTVLEIKGDSLTLQFGGYSNQYPCKIKNNGGLYIVPAKENEFFDILSEIQINQDGSLTAYEMVMDAEGHTYHFVREEDLAEQREIVDASTDAPKEIASEDIEYFSFVFDKSYSSSYGLSDDWPTGFYSWEIDKQSDGSYHMNFRISGDSYIIMDFSDTVSEEYVKGLSQLLKDEKIIEWNGYYMKNNVKRHGWSLYVNYESGENLSVRADGDAAATCVFDMVPLLDYAAIQDFDLDW